MAGAGLLERLEQGHVICAEGYLFELERRGYIQAGAFVPEAVLDHPEKVTELHREFVHAGSDVVEAFTYYAHREKMRVVGKEGLLEELNRNALALAKEVADETGTLFAGDICNTNVFDPDDPESKKAVQAMFDEQVAWAAEAGVDFIIAETYSYAEEARMALETDQGRRPAGGHHDVHPPGADDTRRHDSRRRVRHARAGGRGRRRPQLHPRPRHDHAAPPEHPRAGVGLRRRAAGAVPHDHGDADVPEPAPPPPRRRCSSRPRSSRSTSTRYEVAEFAREADALGIQYLGLCCGDASSSDRGLWPRRSVALRPRAATRRTCPSTPTTAPIRS